MVPVFESELSSITRTKTVSVVSFVMYGSPSVISKTRLWPGKARSVFGSRHVRKFFVQLGEEGRPTPRRMPILSRAACVIFMRPSMVGE